MIGDRGIDLPLGSVGRRYSYSADSRHKGRLQTQGRPKQLDLMAVK